VLDLLEEGCGTDLFLALFYLAPEDALKLSLSE
jgi:hypothetical protein